MPDNPYVPASASSADDPFAGRVDFTGVAQVGVHRHVGIGNEFERPKLGLYQQRQQYGVPLAPETVHRNVVVEGGELHVVEGHPFASAPCVAPFGDHRRHVPGIVRMAAFVRFALIPDESPERVGRERPDHGVVQRSRAVLGIVFRIGGENVVPYVPGGLPAHPGFDARGSPVAFDQADRNAERPGVSCAPSLPTLTGTA